MKRKIPIIAVCVLTLFAVCPSTLFCGVEMGRLQSTDVAVIFEKPLHAAAREVTTIYPDLKEELEKIFGWKLDYSPTIILIKDRKRFQRMVGSTLVAALAVPQRKLIVIDYSRMTSRPFTLRTILKHELCHLLLHAHIEDGKLPRWLDEGIAQWVSEGIGEIVMQRNRSILERAMLTGTYIRLRHLEYHMPDDGNDLLLAYEESKSIVEYILNKFGKEGILKILEHLKDGDGIYTAVRESLALSLPDLEDRWHKHISRKIYWLSLISNYLYEILFFVAALLSLAAYLRRLKRRRDHKDLYEEPDEEDDFFSERH
ncbi:MAG: hypothetical protein JXC33_07460 [Deltaproteobacteria bacterium]|nr:hypothetical protein [Deltaproteobacteria bacterium]